MSKTLNEGKTKGNIKNPPAISKKDIAPPPAPKPGSYAKKRKLAKDYFVFNNMTAKDIADLLGITEKTAGNWRKDDGWDKEREELLANPNEIRRILLKEMKKLANGESTKIDADALSKLSKVMDTLSQKLSPQTVAAVLQELDNWTAEHHPQLAIQNIEPHKAFLRSIIAQHD